MPAVRRPIDERFTNDDLLRRAQTAFGRALTAEEWKIVDPDGSYQVVGADYDATDVKALLADIRDRLPAEERPSAARRQASDHAEALAGRLLPYVRCQRALLLGSGDPPCATLDDAGHWIEDRQRPTNTLLVELALDLPAQAITDVAGPGPFLAVRDWLNVRFPPATPSTEQAETNAEAMGILPALTVGYRMLSYYRPREGTTGEGMVPSLVESADPKDVQPLMLERIPVDSDSELGRLLAAAEGLSRQTNWPVEWSVAHLLTGQRFSSPLRTEAFVTGLERAHVVRIEVLEPEAVTKEMVSEAYDEARKRLPELSFSRAAGQPARLRARARAESVELIAFVKKHSDRSWDGRQRLWNAAHPSDQMSTPAAMRKRFDRAVRPPARTRNSS